MTHNLWWFGTCSNQITKLFLSNHPFSNQLVMSQIKSQNATLGFNFAHHWWYLFRPRASCLKKNKSARSFFVPSFCWSQRHRFCKSRSRQCRQTDSKASERRSSVDRRAVGTIHPWSTRGRRRQPIFFDRVLASSPLETFSIAEERAKIRLMAESFSCMLSVDPSAPITSGRHSRWRQRN